MGLSTFGLSILIKEFYFKLLGRMLLYPCSVSEILKHKIWVFLSAFFDTKSFLKRNLLWKEWISFPAISLWANSFLFWVAIFNSESIPQVSPPTRRRNLCLSPILKNERATGIQTQGFQGRGKGTNSVVLTIIVVIQTILKLYVDWWQRHRTFARCIFNTTTHNRKNMFRRTDTSSGWKTMPLSQSLKRTDQLWSNYF